jgi:hypothetical protein
LVVVQVMKGVTPLASVAVRDTPHGRACPPAALIITGPAARLTYLIGSAALPPVPPDPAATLAQSRGSARRSTSISSVSQGLVNARSPTGHPSRIGTIAPRCHPAAALGRLPLKGTGPLAGRPRGSGKSSRHGPARSRSSPGALERAAYPGVPTRGAAVGQAATGSPHRPRSWE